MGYAKELYIKEMNEECFCKEIKIRHIKGEHDWCCQICGGFHIERICPNREVK